MLSIISQCIDGPLVLHPSYPSLLGLAVQDDRAGSSASVNALHLACKLGFAGIAEVRMANSWNSCRAGVFPFFVWLLLSNWKGFFA
jgi:hypothetical protein